MGEDMEKPLEANLDTGLGEKIKRDKKGKIIVDMEMWKILEGTTKAQIKKGTETRILGGAGAGKEIRTGRGKDCGMRNV